MMSLGAQAPSIPRALGHLAPCRDAFPRVASRIARVVAVGGTTAPAASLRKVTDLPGSTHLQSAWISASGAAFDGIFGDILSRNIERGPAHIRATARGGLAVSGDHHAQRLESEARTRHGGRDVKQFLIMGDESSERSGSGARLQGFWGHIGRRPPLSDLQKRRIFRLRNLFYTPSLSSAAAPSLMPISMLPVGVAGEGGRRPMCKCVRDSERCEFF